MSDESSTNARNSRPTRHVVLKYSSGTGPPTPVSESDSRSRPRNRKRRLSMDPQSVDDQSLQIPVASVRRSSRHNLLPDEDEEEEDISLEQEQEKEQDPEQEPEQEAEPEPEQELEEDSFRDPSTPPPRPAARGVGRPKGRTRGRKPGSATASNGPSPRKSRRTAGAAGPNADEAAKTKDEDDENYELLQHEADMATLPDQDVSHRSAEVKRAFDSVNSLYSINLEEEETWRDTADSIAICLDNLRDQWHDLEMHRRQLLRSSRS